ncbi:hypothetical protein Trydic_g13692 [Trypoxylus dichotomus]
MVLGTEPLADWDVVDGKMSCLQTTIKSPYPFISTDHDVSMKETYENFKIPLEKIKYEDYFWNICADFKVIALILDIHSVILDTVASYAFATVPTGKGIELSRGGYYERSLYQEKSIQYFLECLDTNEQVDVVYTDFPKAFDRVDNGLLLDRSGAIDVVAY